MAGTSPTRRLTRDEWEYEIRRNVAVREAMRRKVKNTKYEYFENFVSKLMPLPFIIGGTAIFLLWKFYGWQILFEFMLSWIVSLTLVATGMYYLWRYLEKQI